MFIFKVADQQRDQRRNECILYSNFQNMLKFYYTQTTIVQNFVFGFDQTLFSPEIWSMTDLIVLKIR